MFPFCLRWPSKHWLVDTRVTTYSLDQILVHLCLDLSSAYISQRIATFYELRTTLLSTVRMLSYQYGSVEVWIA